LYSTSILNTGIPFKLFFFQKEKKIVKKSKLAKSFFCLKKSNVKRRPRTRRVFFLYLMLEIKNRVKQAGNQTNLSLELFL